MLRAEHQRVNSQVWRVNSGVYTGAWTEAVPTPRAERAAVPLGGVSRKYPKGPQVCWESWGHHPTLSLSEEEGRKEP